MPDEVATRAAAYQTVEIFSGITGTRLFLKHGKRAANDGRAVIAPFKDALFYEHVEHGLSHILFESDGRAKAQFVQDYSRLVVQSALDNGTHIEGRKVRHVLSEFISILDDERVMGLWGLLYPGSEFTYRTYKYEVSARSLHAAHHDLTSLFHVLAGGHEPCGGELIRFVPIFRKALTMVQECDYRAVLVTAKWLMTQVVDELLRIQNGVASEEALEPALAEDPEARADALEKAVFGAQSEPKPDLNDVEQNQYATPKEKDRAQDTSIRALRQPVKDPEVLEAGLGETKTAMLAIVEHAKSALRPSRDENDRLRKDAKAKVVFLDVGHKDVKAQVEIPYEDQATISRLRAMFHRVMGRRTRVLEFEGTEVDPVALIQRRVTGEDIPPFRVDTPGRGFKSLVLIDRSTSMEGTRTRRAERACRILNRSLKFPFVKASTWGFQSMHLGQVDIVRFEEGVEVFTTPKSKVAGNTPLHVAIHVAARQLEPGHELKQMFVVTDGMPIFFTRGGEPLSERQLLHFVRHEVRDARRRGIQVTAVLVGQRSRDDAKKMQFMFGASRNWRIVTETSFERDLIGLVSQSFVRYLRHG